MKVLHTIDPDAPGGGPYTMALLADLVGATPQVEHEVVVIGPDSRVPWVRSFGLEPAASLPRRPAWLGRRQRDGRRDDMLVHAWEVSSAMHLGAAALVTATREPAGADTTAELARNGSLLLAPAAPIADAWRRAGVGGPRCRTVLPGIDPRRLRGEDRRDIRERWSARAGEVLVGILCDPPEAADVWNAAQLQSLLVTADRAARIVVHDGGRHHAEGGRWARSLGLDHMLIRDADLGEPWRVAAGLDIAVVLGGGALPVLWAMAAGLPVVAERGGGVETLIEHDRNGLLIDAGDVNDLCRHLIKLNDDPPRRETLGHAAREAALRDHGAEAFGERVVELYRELS